MNKTLISLLCLTGLCATASAETPQETIASLQKEVAALRIAVGQAEKPIVLASNAEVEIAAAREAAVQRIKEANQVARQWRAKAITLQKDLSYTKAVLVAQGGAPETELTEASILLPKFRAADVAVRAAGTTDLAAQPAYAVAR